MYSGTDIIKRAKLEELKTNMLLIETKAKECVENANFKLGKTDNLGDTEKTTRINEAKKGKYAWNRIVLIKTVRTE